MREAGARSSVDESRSDGAEDETTVVEPDQGNGEAFCPSIHTNTRGELLMGSGNSAVAYHLAVETGRGSESGGAADFYPRA